MKPDPNALPAPPAVARKLPAARPSAEALELLLTRRSSVAAAMGEPGPSEAELGVILRAAARVPDHRKLVPFRFLVFRGAARDRIGAVFAAAQKADYPDFPAERIEFERTRFLRAPLVVAVISSPKQDPKQTPEWEQRLCAAAVCQTMLIAASAMGYAAQWLTEWCAYDRRVLDAMGLTENEKIAGFIYLATATEDPLERERPDIAAITQDWGG
jgi:nitroreductase